MKSRLLIVLAVTLLASQVALACPFCSAPSLTLSEQLTQADAAVLVQWVDGKTPTEKSAGSKILSISGDCAAPGIYEYPFGVTIRQVLDDCGAKDAQAVQVGGPSGTLINSAEFDRRLGFDDLSTGGSLMVFSQARDLLAVIVNFAHFFAHESCGFCTPCRVGTVLLKNGLDKIAGGHGTQYDLDEMQRLAALVKCRSHCGLESRIRRQ